MTTLKGSSGETPAASPSTPPAPKLSLKPSLNLSLATQLDLLQQYVGELSFMRSAPATLDSARIIRLVQIVEGIETIIAECATAHSNGTRDASPDTFARAIADAPELAAIFSKSDTALRSTILQLRDRWDETCKSDIRSTVDSAAQSIARLHSLARRTYHFVEKKVYTKRQVKFRHMAPWIILSAILVASLCLFGYLAIKHRPIELPPPIVPEAVVPGIMATYFETDDYQTKLGQQKLLSVNIRTNDQMVNPVIKKAPYSVQISGYLFFSPQQIQKTNLWYLCMKHDDVASLRINDMPVIESAVTEKNNAMNVINMPISLNAMSPNNETIACRRLHITAPGMYPLTLLSTSKDEAMLLGLMWGVTRNGISPVPGNAFFSLDPNQTPVQAQ